MPEGWSPGGAHSGGLKAGRQHFSSPTAPQLVRGLQKPALKHSIFLGGSSATQRCLPAHPPQPLGSEHSNFADWQAEGGVHFPDFPGNPQLNWTDALRASSQLSKCPTGSTPVPHSIPTPAGMLAGQCSTTAGPTHNASLQKCLPSHKGQAEASGGDQPLLTDRQKGCPAHSPPTATAAQPQQAGRRW